MLSGRVAFVTGGGGSLGRAACCILARDGAKVVIVDINDMRVKKTLSLLPGTSHSHYILDITDREKLEAVVAGIIGRYNVPPTIVVNCGEVFKGLMCLPLEMNPNDFDRHYSVNVKGTLNVIQVICKEMIKHKLPGSVINLGTAEAGSQMRAWFSDYSASKAAVTNLTKSLSSELGAHNIRCNIVLLGMIEASGSCDEITEEHRQEFYSQSDLKRPGTPEEVAEVIAFLASDKSSYVTGASINVSGGI